MVLQGAWTDIQTLAHFLAREEKFTCKEWFVCLCYLLNSLAYSADSGQHHLHNVLEFIIHRFNKGSFSE